ncbi:MAG TPA: TatD family hydrolase [Xanthomonadaceae bacterium]|nr:TatD family hydrolase [Xanthomonadaceae bacterium]
MTLVDIGANLTHASFGQDLDAVLARAREAGVLQIVVTGASREGSVAAHALAQAHAGLFATAGVHPHHAADYDADTDALLRELAARDPVRAVGETGLDYHRNYSPRADQLRAFEQQLQIAVDTGKPLFLHQRDAHADLIACLDPVRDRIARAVVHCFTGSREELYDYLDRDLYIGITGWLCDERRSAHLRQLVREIPADRLLIETDAPYLLPRTLEPKPPHRRNEPMYLAHLCAELARDRGEPVVATAAATAAAARTFFDLPPV